VVKPTATLKIGIAFGIQVAADSRFKGRLDMLRSDTPPTILHFTHYKAGSQWIHWILSRCCPERIVKPEVHGRHLTDHPIQSGVIYPTMYLTPKRERLPAEHETLVLKVPPMKVASDSPHREQRALGLPIKAIRYGR
jgi:hypothetical protein